MNLINLFFIIFLILFIFKLNHTYKKRFILNNKHYFKPLKSINYDNILTSKIINNNLININNDIKNNVLNNNIITYKDAYNNIKNELELLKKNDSNNVDPINILLGFLDKHIEIIETNKTCDAHEILNIYLKYIEGLKKYRYYNFPNFHEYDKEYYKWSLDFWSSIIDKKNSKYYGIENIKKITNWINDGDNIFIVGNHHIEADANLIRYFFNLHDYDNISRSIIFIGGHKIRMDPLSKPFTASNNILCVYSKKYIENPIHLKDEKIQFNLKSLQQLQKLLKKGKQIIWLAASGGRDQFQFDGTHKIPLFDSKNINMLNLFAKKSKIKTHFIAMALNTHKLCPPSNIDIDKTEQKRVCNFSPIYINLGDDIFNIYPNMKEENLTINLYNYVNQLYKKLS